MISFMKVPPSTYVLQYKLGTIKREGAGLSFLAGFCGGTQLKGVRMAWDDRRLQYVVREPFLSRHSQIGIVAGMLEPEEEMTLESLMPFGGAIFIDGMEMDYLEFNSGAIAHVCAAEQRARLVVS
jgi:hypothetical protein